MQRRRPDAFSTGQPGIVTRHVFSAGAHYDPANVSCGPVIGCDEHVIEPGAGFDWHAHRGVVIVSWVLDGALRHEDADGRVLVVEPGTVLVQSTGPGIRHRETNDSDVPLRFVQTTLLLDGAASVRTARPPIELGTAVRVDIARSVPAQGEGLAVELDDVDDVLVVHFGS